MGLFHSPKIVTDGLVLCLDAANQKSYPGSGTNWLNLISSSYTASLLNGVSYSTDNGGVMIFDGVDDYANIATSPILTTLTGEVWFNISGTTPDYHPLFQKEGGFSGGAVYGIRIGSPDNIPYGMIYYSTVSADVVTVSANTVCTAGVWYNITITYDSFYNLKIYINGELENTSTGTSVPRQSSTNLLIGTGDGRDADGKMGVLKVYNRALSAAEVRQNFEALRGRYGI